MNQSIASATDPDAVHSLDPTPRATSTPALQNQLAPALQRAADSSGLNAMAQASHRLKTSAARLGATRLSRVVASTEQAARAGKTSAALAFMREFQDLAKASHEAMDALRRTVFRSTV